MNNIAFDIFSIIFSVCVVIVCSLLLLFTLRIPNKGNDTKLLILIVIIELIAPLLNVVDPIYTQVNGEQMLYNHAACTVTGFFYEFIFYYEVIFNTFLAIERVLIFKKSKIIRVIKWTLTINSTIFLILMIFCATAGAIMPGIIDFLCHLNMMSYPLATFTHFFRDLNILGGILTIIYCYYEISKKVNGFRKIQNNEIELSTSYKLRSKKFRVAIIKAYISLSVYGILMLTACGSFFIKGILSCLDEARFGNTINSFHVIGVLFFCFGFFANSTLILFFHTGVRHEAKKFQDQVKGYFKR